MKNRPLWSLIAEDDPKFEQVKAFFVGDGPMLPSKLELSVRGKDRDARIVAFSNTFLASDRGLPEPFVATGIDITERKRAEDALTMHQTQSHVLHAISAGASG